MAATTPPSSPSTWSTLPPRCWCGCAPTAASTPTRHAACWEHGPAAPPRRQVQLRRPGHLAGPDRYPGSRRRPVRCRDRQGVGGAASQAAAPPRPWQPRTAADRARHHPPRAGQARARQDPPAEGAVAVVGRPRPARSGPAWRAYVRRFDLEHTVRFCTQTLGWTTPRPRHPEQADRWTCLVLGVYAQLRLACRVACDQQLPWERRRPLRRLSPVRVRRGFPQLLVLLGSPANARNPQDTRQGGQGPLLRTREALSGDQEARQRAPQAADQDRHGRLTGPGPLPL
jgi:hypothetical protein